MVEILDMTFSHKLMHRELIVTLPLPTAIREGFGGGNHLYDRNTAHNIDWVEHPDLTALSE